MMMMMMMMMIVVNIMMISFSNLYISTWSQLSMDVEHWPEEGRVHIFDYDHA